MKGKVIQRCSEHNNPKYDWEPVKHLESNLNHSANYFILLMHPVINRNEKKFGSKIFCLNKTKCPS